MANEFDVAEYVQEVEVVELDLREDLTYCGVPIKLPIAV